MRVTSPPSNDPNDTGIRSLEGTVLAPSASVAAAGMRMTVAAMLFMNADITPTMSTSSTIRGAAGRKSRDERGNRRRHSGFHQTGAQDEHGRHRDHGGTAKSAEHAIRRHQAGKGHGEQRQDANQIRTHTLTGKEHQAPPSTPIRIQPSGVIAPLPSFRGQVMG